MTARAFAKVNDLFGGRLEPAAGRRLRSTGSSTMPRQVDTSRTHADLGLEFRPLRETVADAIRWWAEHDLIDRRLAGKLAPKPV